MAVVGNLGKIGLGMGAVFLAAGCRNSVETRLEVEWWRLEAERVSLKAEVELAAFRLGDLEASGSRWNEAEARLAELRETRTTLERQLLDLQETSARMAEAVTVRRQESLARRRQSWTGQTLSSLHSLDGRRFDDVQISQVTPIGVKFRHRTGLARLTADKLGALQCDRFGIDPGQSRELAARERETQQLTRQRWETAAAEAAESAVPDAPAPVVASYRPQPRPSERTNPLDEPARRFGGVNHRVRSHRTRYYYVWPTCRTRPAWNIQSRCRPAPVVSRPSCPPFSQP